MSVDQVNMPSVFVVKPKNGIVRKIKYNPNFFESFFTVLVILIMIQINYKNL